MAPRKKVRKKVQKRGKKRRGSAAKRNSSREVMNRPVVLSAELAAVVGAKELSRPEAVSRLWAYCREKNLLNPKDKREILCDARLQKLLGKKATHMFGLQGCLAPHFKGAAEEDDADDVGEDEEEQEEADEDEDEEQEEPQGIDLNAVAQSLVLRVVRLERKEVTLNFTTRTSQCDFEVFATPANKTGVSAAIRAICSVRECENAPGDVEYCGEAHLKGLDPACGYTIAIQIRSLNNDSESKAVRTPEITVPQRARPEKWSVRETQLWCQSIKVPELVEKVKAYGVDGATLLAFTEEDLRGVGISTPFVLRRVLSALKVLGGG